MKLTTLLNILFVLIFGAGFSSSATAQTNSQNTDPMIVQAQVLPFEWNPGQGGSLEMKISLPDGYHAYEDKFDIVVLEPEGFKVGPLHLDPVKTWYDKFSKKDRSGIEKAAVLKAALEAPSRFLKKYPNLKIQMTYQACTDQFCLFPTKKEISIPIQIAVSEQDSQLLAGEAERGSHDGSFFSTENFSRLLGQNIVVGLFFVFLAGIITSFTPCIFPMIPITLAVLGHNSNERSRLQNLITSCVYVLGIASTYSILGLIAATSGGIFGASLGNPYVLSAICAVFLAMALSMYGLFEIQVPAFVRNRFGRSNQKQNLAGAFLSGLIAGIVASPCIGPVLVAILTYVASTQNKFLGFLYLFVYAVGLGLIFIFLGLSNQFVKFLPKSGSWMNLSKFILGTLMLSAFYYYLSLLIPTRFFEMALGAGLVTIGSIYGAFIKPQGSTLHHLRKGVMMACLYIGIGFVALGAFDLRSYLKNSEFVGSGNLKESDKLPWQAFTAESLDAARKSGKPVIIDFWADWCLACHELVEKTFTDPRVHEKTEGFVLLKFDATQDSEVLRQLKKQYNIQGLPTLIFYNQEGQWVDGLTLTQFENADKFLERLGKIKP